MFPQFCCPFLILPKDFKLQGNPPRLLVNTSLDLDSSGNVPSERRFTVVVSDERNEATASVTVSVTMVNEFPPVMPQLIYYASVQENDTRGHRVQQVALCFDAMSYVEVKTEYTLGRYFTLFHT